MSLYKETMLRNSLKTNAYTLNHVDSIEHFSRVIFNECAIHEQSKVAQQVKCCYLICRMPMSSMCGGKSVLHVAVVCAVFVQCV